MIPKSVTPGAELVRHHCERAELRDIKERFTNYIRNVKILRNHLTQGDGFAAVRRLEQEVLGIRTAYEQEIQSLRETLEKYRELAQEGISRDNPTAPEHHSRLMELNRDIMKKDQEIRDLQVLVAQKEAEMQGLKMAAVAPSIQLDVAKQELEDLYRSVSSSQERYEEELCKRLQLQEQVVDLTCRLDQITDKHRKESQEMRDRIDQSEALVLQLEQKLRAESGGGSALMEAVHKIQEASEAEVKRLQNETESVYSQSLLQLQMRMNCDQRLLSRTQEEKQQLQQQVEELTGELSLTHRKIFSAETDSRTLMGRLESELRREGQRVRELEIRLEELQDVLLAKLKESAAFQETNVSLRNELDALRSLLEEEEQQMSSDKFNLATSLSSCAPPLAPSSLSSDPPVSPLIGSLDSPPAESPQLPTSAQSEEQKKNFDRIAKHGEQTRPTSAPPLSLRNVQLDPPATVRHNLTLIGHKPASINNCTPAISSALRNLAITEVDPGGKFVKIMNKSVDKEEDIGGYILQQNIGGHPVALYRFPPKTRVTAHSEVTVWAASANVPHEPPGDFLWKDLEEFVTGPQGTTILCKANGHAVAWYTPMRNSCSRSLGGSGDETPNISRLWTLPRPQESGDSQPQSPKQVQEGPDELQKWEKGPVLLRRERLSPAVLPPTCSPWTQSAASPTHPDFSPSQSWGPESGGFSKFHLPVPHGSNAAPSAGGRSRRNPSAAKKPRNSRGPTRSAGTSAKGVLYLGYSSPAGSILQKYMGNSSYNIRLASQGSLSPAILSGV
ncbi:lamin-L(II)-like isoform X2 [Xenopus laevis]|uniref:Lamin-L(II)-like isoform X2 n=2 Tax=Xenopus laevis TaxID=8355 RepID=A0A1L8GQF5_XENLA|nr:lamin-L(II)-like isoform X2 [Xenopus laevis]OCT86019.1 hypothetical protein XELAEV_18019712mg [Xenopus laevis]